MAETNIVPFGKYRGQPIEVLQQDREYCDWLVSQEWFRAKFVGIHTLIVNHFGEPHETPEHNLLQARFLDPVWCQRFVLRVGFEHQARRQLRYRIAEARERLQKAVAAIEQVSQGLEHERNEGYAQYLRDDISRRQGECDRLLRAIADVETCRKWMFSADAECEVDGVDVVLEVTLESETSFDAVFFSNFDNKPRTVTLRANYSVECKPLLGDDYPAILRSMKTTDAAYLIAGVVRSALSQDVIGEIFDRSGKRLVTVAEIEAQPLFWPVERQAEE